MKKEKLTDIAEGQSNPRKATRLMSSDQNDLVSLWGKAQKSS
jgi:hypothetical protein